MWLQIKGKWWLLFISISKAGLEKHGKDFITLMAATSLCLLLQCKNLKLTHKNNSTLFNFLLYLKHILMNLYITLEHRCSMSSFLVYYDENTPMGKFNCKFMWQQESWSLYLVLLSIAHIGCFASPESLQDSGMAPNIHNILWALIHSTKILWAFTTWEVHVIRL